MTHSRKRALCWLYAALMTAAMMLYVLLCTEVSYAMNDDAGILRAFLGYESGVPASFHIYIHGLLAWPLRALSTAFPGLPWFSYAQLALLALACLVIAKSLMQCFVKHEKALWAGAVLAGVVLAALCMKYVIRLTFTQTSALLGAAAVLQICSIEHDRGGAKVVLGMAGALVLVAFSYALRQITALPVLAFCGLAWLIALWEAYGKKQGRSIRPMLLSLVMVAVVMLGLVGVRELEIRQSDAQGYLAWQEANTDVIDFYGLSSVPDEAFDLVGWDESTRAMAKKWCFLDSDLSSEAFLTLTEYMDTHDQRTFADRVKEAGDTFAGVVRGNADDMLCLLPALIVGLCTLIFAVAHRRWTVVFGIAAAVCGSAVMLFYLAYGGRLPLRALLMVALPASALFFGLLPAALPKKAQLPLVVCCAAIAVWCVAVFLPGMLPDEEADLELGNAMGDLEEYALSEPESLFIYDDTLVGADVRAFPDYSEGVPHNITFWGGWGLRSPENKQLFERFGIDLDHFEPETLLRDDVFIASGRVDPPPMLILNWLHEKVGENIDWEIWSEYGNVYIFHFYEY